MQTGEFELRQLTQSDAADFAALYADPAVNHGHPVIGADESDIQLLRRISNLCEIHLGIFVDGKLAGDCALHHWNPELKTIEIGGALSPDFQGMGIMAKAFPDLIEKARNMGAARILGRTDPQNHAAIRLVEKMGFLKNDPENGELVLVLDL